VVGAAGDVLDTARVTIPEGKFGYLLENPSKAGVFGDAHPGAMGYAPDSLDTALRAHLVDEFHKEHFRLGFRLRFRLLSLAEKVNAPSGSICSPREDW